MSASGGSRCAEFGRLCAVALLLALLGAPLAAQSGFLGTDGEPLPFSSFEEVEEFLRTADIVWIKKMGSGTSKEKRKVLLRQGDIQAHAVLRRIYEIADTPGGGFVDSYLSELAAYELSRLLGLDNVPPVVRRKGGSLQIWVERAMPDADRRRAGIAPPDPAAYERQLLDMHVFDNLIANTDRNLGNVLVGSDGRLWLIDHTRSFAGQRQIKYPERIAGCSRRLWDRLRTVTPAEIRRAVEPYARRQIEPLLLRRELLVQELAARIADGGEAAFLF